MQCAAVTTTRCQQETDKPREVREEWLMTTLARVARIGVASKGNRLVRVDRVNRECDKEGGTSNEIVYKDAEVPLGDNNQVKPRNREREHLVAK